MKCVNCKHCIGMWEDKYMCNLEESIDLIDECIANDENMLCEFYEQDMVDGNQA